MVHILGNKITIQQGDSSAFRILIIDAKGREVALSTDLHITMRAKNLMNPASILVKDSTPISMNGDSKVYHIIHFDSNDTIDLVSGVYEYEVVLSYDDVRVKLISNAVLVIEESIFSETLDSSNLISQRDYSDILSSTPLVAVLNLRSYDKVVLDSSDDLILF